MTVLLFVLLLQIFVRLLNTVGKQTINDALWNVFTKLPISSASHSSDSKKLRGEVVRLDRELKATSSQDEFAKWARLRRQLDKAKEKYDAEAKDQQSLRTNFDRAITALRFIGLQGVQFACNTYYAKQAMFWLPQGWVPYHVEWILSFPKAPLGSVSVYMWAMACGSVVSMLIEGVLALWTLRSGMVPVGPRKGEKVKMEPMAVGGRGEKKEL